ncbi:MAG TPA: ribonuclease HII, partial [Gammaproteobacteria bacterium]|nr:ribonuclease HII [Gammaproteobacteria bacterium]
LGMTRALERLALAPELALIDGNRLPEFLPCVGRAIVGGDASEPSISAASILAKVTRDRLLVEYEARWPGYGFAQHKGYPTPEHFAALQRLGPCPEHRRSFAPVRAVLERSSRREHGAEALID